VTATIAKPGTMPFAAAAQTRVIIERSIIVDIEIPG
jgi:hypothetical protein